MITPWLVINFIIVFVLLYLFLKTIDKRKWLVFIIAGVLTPIVYFYLFYPFVNIFSAYHHQKYFNSEKWIEEPALRYEMIDNMVASDTLIGFNKNEVENQLGKAEWLSWNDSLKAHDDNHWNYGMGIEPGAFNDNKESVEVIFAEDKVIELRPFQEKITFKDE